MEEGKSMDKNCTTIKNEKFHQYLLTIQNKLVKYLKDYKNITKIMINLT